jgi:SAM-dependent methyltransferase
VKAYAAEPVRERLFQTIPEHPRSQRQLDPARIRAVAEPPKTWHYGLIARWWAEFNHDGPEIEYFRRFVEAGQPALDVGCGTGRLLRPYVRAGLDVDGCDVSADMIALCREQAAREGFSPELFVQPMHELTPPRRYSTIYVCGAFGLGSTREQDREALRRIHDHLEPGGTFVIDNEVPYANETVWRYWTKETRATLPEELEPPKERRRTSDGDELALSSRVLNVDPLEQRVTLEMFAELWRDGELQSQEDRRLTLNFYFRDELLAMLASAGFGDITVKGGYEGAEPTPEHDFLVFIARRAE